MILIDQHYEIIQFDKERILPIIERVARTCYKSEDKIKAGSDVVLVDRLIKRGHFAMLEFQDIIVKLWTNRGVTHELVRHRLCSYAQESTRYVRYDGSMEFIRPVWWNESTEAQKAVFLRSCGRAEVDYKELLDLGWSPQQAREVLPNALKTEINVKANIREWRHIFNMRYSEAAHPQICGLMQPLLLELKGGVPLVFDGVGMI